jgi:ubiquinone/menaquinone biosynthesis C-methylase UbiE
METAERGYVPALRFHALTPLFDSVSRLANREGQVKSGLIEQAQLRSGQSVLDIGAGTGTLAIMAKRVEPGCDVRGLDADPKILDIARRKAQAAGVEVAFDEALATELPYGDGSFDRVLSTLFFHHLDPAGRRQGLTEIRRVLRPGGELHVADYTRAADPLQAVMTWQVRLADGRERTRELFDGELPHLLVEAGFQDVAELHRIRTFFGTLGLVRASTP